MSGHSKWSQIKHKKSASDAKRGQLFSKLSRFITIAAKELGEDPLTNSKLAQAIEEAKAANMPKDNIERAIKRAEEKDAASLKETLYEAYGPGGSALIITAITDNTNRTTNEIKHLLTENGGKLGEQGSAVWAFDKKGLDYIPKYPLRLSQEDSHNFDNLLTTLDEQEDIQNVYSNTA